jgi:N-acetylmuramoyl-L-alanine amidase
VNYPKYGDRKHNWHSNQIQQVGMVRSMVRGFLLFFLILWISLPGAQITSPVVVLSPGHGLNEGAGVIDPGAVKGDLAEKDINLEVAQRAQEYLARCPLTVSLTRTGDDPHHTQADLAGIINNRKPSLAVAIHTAGRSSRKSGAQGWYTAGGFDDKNSRKLARLLSVSVKDWLSIPDVGDQPETKAPGGMLEIHDWKAPAALVEIGDISADTAALTSRRRDFGRAIASAVLDYLGLPLTCADGATSSSIIIGTYFPGDIGTNEIRLTNDGLLAWNAGPQGAQLKNLSGLYGAKKAYPLAKDTPVGKEAAWQVDFSVPATPGIYQQVWQVQRIQQPASKKITAYLVVLPQGAKDLKEKIDEDIQNLRQQSQEEAQKYIDQLKQQVAEWVTQQIEQQIRQCFGGQALVGVVAVTFVAQLWRKKKKGGA